MKPVILESGISPSIMRFAGVKGKPVGRKMRISHKSNHNETDGIYHQYKGSRIS